MIRPLSAYGSSTKRVRRMVSLYLTEVEGMYTMQTITSLKGSSRNNQNKGWEDAQQMRENAAAKAENRAMMAGTYSLVKTDPRACTHIMRHLRGPHKGTHLVEVIPKEYRRNSMLHSTLQERTSQIRHWILKVR